jgi:hypothetical protein
VHHRLGERVRRVRSRRTASPRSRARARAGSSARTARPPPRRRGATSTAPTSEIPPREVLALGHLPLLARRSPASWGSPLRSSRRGIRPWFSRPPAGVGSPLRPRSSARSPRPSRRSRAASRRCSPASTVVDREQAEDEHASPPTILIAKPTESTLTCGMVRITKPMPTRMMSTIARRRRDADRDLRPRGQHAHRTSSGGPTPANPPIGSRSKVPARIRSTSRARRSARRR